MEKKKKLLIAAAVFAAIAFFAWNRSKKSESKKTSSGNKSEESENNSSGSSSSGNYGYEEDILDEYDQMQDDNQDDNSNPIFNTVNESLKELQNQELIAQEISNSAVAPETYTNTGKLPPKIVNSTITGKINLYPKTTTTLQNKSRRSGTSTNSTVTTDIELQEKKRRFSGKKVTVKLHRN